MRSLRHDELTVEAGIVSQRGLAQRVHVGIWYILRAQRGSHIPTLRPNYIPLTYMDPLGRVIGVV